jgi:hypothetical protein
MTIWVDCSAISFSDLPAIAACPVCSTIFMLDVESADAERIIFPYNSFLTSYKNDNNALLKIKTYSVK